MSAEYRAAIERLLDKPDPPDLRGINGRPRGNYPVARGDRDRMVTTWLPAAQAWTCDRISQVSGIEDGWKSARKSSLPFFLQPIDIKLIREGWKHHGAKAH